MMIHLHCRVEIEVDLVHEGDSIEVKGAHVASFKGDKQLRLGKNGSVTVLEKPLGN